MATFAITSVPNAAGAPGIGPQIGTTLRRIERWQQDRCCTGGDDGSGLVVPARHSRLAAATARSASFRHGARRRDRAGFRRGARPG